MNLDHIKIHRATKDHVNEICDIENELFDNAFGLGTIQQELVEGWGAIALCNNAVVGYALIRPNPWMNDLLRLGVTKPYQRKGIGRRLLQLVKSEVTGPTMLLVQKNNKSARALYQSEGFVIRGQTEESWLLITNVPT